LSQIDDEDHYFEVPETWTEKFFQMYENGLKEAKEKRGSHHPKSIIKIKRTTLALSQFALQFRLQVVLWNQESALEEKLAATITAIWKPGLGADDDHICFTIQQSSKEALRVVERLNEYSLRWNGFEPLEAEVISKPLPDASPLPPPVVADDDEEVEDPEFGDSS
jgi:hypothetical protein